MSTTRRCPRCGATLSKDRIGCPRCLLEAARDAASEASAAAAPDRRTPPTPAELAPDFPQLEIEALVGQGGMGCVYRARHAQLGRSVALKILAPGSEDDARFEERFLREARALARLDHPGIVRVYDFGRAGTRWFLLMEFVEGANLRSLLQGGRLPPQQALAIVPQLCDALQYAHSAGVVHRDIKPENVLVDASGRVKLADFGLAKLLDTQVGARSATEAVMGTLNYMAPEQISRPREVDHRADIYSLGVVFYEMLTGELPLGRFEPPSKRMRVDVHVDEVVLKSLEQAPERRYQHAVDVRTDLERSQIPAPAAQAAPREPAGSRSSSRRPSPVRDVALWFAGSLVLWTAYWMVGFRLGLAAMSFHGLAQALLAFLCMRREIVETNPNRLVARVAVFAVAIVLGCSAWTLRSVAAWDETTSSHWEPGRFAASMDLVQPETQRAAEVAYGPKRVAVSQLRDVSLNGGSEIERLDPNGWFLVALFAWLLAGAALPTGQGKSRGRTIALASFSILGVQLLAALVISDGFRVLAPDEPPEKPQTVSFMSRSGHGGADRIVRQWIEEQNLGIAHESEWSVSFDGKQMDEYRARLIVADELSMFDRWRFDPLRGPRPRLFQKLELVLVCLHSSGHTTVAWRAARVEDSARRAVFEHALSDLQTRLTR